MPTRPSIRGAGGVGRRLESSRKAAPTPPAPKRQVLRRQVLRRQVLRRQVLRRQVLRRQVLDKPLLRRQTQKIPGRSPAAHRQSAAAAPAREHRLVMGRSPVPPLPEFRFPDPAAWEAWLEEHHATAGAFFAPLTGARRPGPVRPGPARPGPVRSGPARPGPVRPGPARPGPARPPNRSAASPSRRPPPRTGRRPPTGRRPAALPTVRPTSWASPASRPGPRHRVAGLRRPSPWPGCRRAARRSSRPDRAR
jgi:hypothetical protein